MIESKGNTTELDKPSPKTGSGDVSPQSDLFGPEPVKLEPCTWAECIAGHRWTPALAISKCPGDQSPVLAIQKVNCPICNDPMVKTQIRCDLVPRGGGISIRCQGQQPYGESLDLIIEHNGWREAETSTLDFEAKRVQERVSGSKVQ